jgi:predicted 2-oxoglutarate/Fe(II)-dependent dioxygenase YbiX
MAQTSFAFGFGSPSSAVALPPDDTAFLENGIFRVRDGATRWWDGDATNLPLVAASEVAGYIGVAEDLLSPEQCALLIASFNRNIENRETVDPNPMWRNRFLWHSELPEGEQAVLALIQQARLRAMVLMQQTFRLSAPLYPDTAQLVVWREGMEMDAHSDNTFPDGSPNPTSQSAFASILYLNDDYEGGETFFPGYGVRLAPKAGTLVVFGAGTDYVHGVTKVTRGTRYTLAGWCTYRADCEDESGCRVY